MKRIPAFLVSLLCLAVMIPVYFAAPFRAQAVVSDFSDQTVYEALLAMKSQYPEGMRFDNSTPYQADTKPYVWEAARLRCGGCAAFAALLSDAVFGKDLPVREFDDIHAARPGDVLRCKGSWGQHTVIVLRKLTDSVEVAEANYNSSVHWGRTIPFCIFIPAIRRQVRCAAISTAAGTSLRTTRSLCLRHIQNSFPEKAAAFPRRSFPVRMPIRTAGSGWRMRSSSLCIIRGMLFPSRIFRGISF